MSTTKPCDVCGEHSSWKHGPVDFMGASAEQLGIPFGNYHYLCALQKQREMPDPHPSGSRATVVDYDGETILGPYLVVRSYWPHKVVELLVEEPHSHLVRQNHDRMKVVADG